MRCQFVASVLAATASGFSHGASGFAQASTSGLRQPRLAVSPRIRTFAPSATANAASPLEEDRVCTVCVALLGQYSRIDDMFEGGTLEERELGFSNFSALVDTLEVQCTEPDKKTIFEMIDTDSSGSIDAKELKSALRSSGAITRMYDESLRTFFALLAATLAFDVGVFAFKGGPAAADFLAAYALEDSLSVDNLFVFLLIFRYFKVPPQLVDICLNYGITGSILLRGIFIFAGLAAANAFAPLQLGFAGFLIFSSYQLLRGEEDEEDELPPAVVELLGRLPLTTTFEGEQFAVTAADGSTKLTLLTATLLCIALCDVIFAVDSIPAVLAVSSDPFVVYTSNIAAVVGLRSLYKILSVAVADLIYLEQAVALVLGFVGVKLGVEFAGVEVNSAASLGVIVFLLGGGVLLSQLADAEEREAHQPHQPTGALASVATVLVQLREAASELKRAAWTNKEGR